PDAQVVDHLVEIAGRGERRWRADQRDRRREREHGEQSFVHCLLSGGGCSGAGTPDLSGPVHLLGCWWVAAPLPALPVSPGPTTRALERGAFDPRKVTAPSPRKSRSRFSARKRRVFSAW